MHRLRRLAARVVSLAPRRLQQQLSRARLFMPYYHMVSDERVAHFVRCVPHYPSTRRFEDELDFILRHYRPVSLDTVLQLASAPAATARDSFHISFDDGYREMHDVVAPILLRKGVPATFFVNTSLIDNARLHFNNKVSLFLERGGSADAAARFSWRDEAALNEAMAELGIDASAYARRVRPYLTTEQASAMIRQGFSFGSHGLDHIALGELGLSEQLRQATACADMVEATFLTRCSTFAFPGGDDGVSLEALRLLHGRFGATFGGANGFAPELPRHFQRLSLEYSNERIEMLLADRLLVEVGRRVSGRDRLQRPLEADAP